MVVAVGRVGAGVESFIWTYIVVGFIINLSVGLVLALCAQHTYIFVLIKFCIRVSRFATQRTPNGMQTEN